MTERTVTERKLAGQLVAFTGRLALMSRRAAVDLGVCPSIAFLKRGSNNRVACGTRAPDLARLSDE